MKSQCFLDGVMRVWDATNYCLLKEAYAPGAPPIGYAKFTPNGQYILSGTFDSVVRLWKADTDVLTTVKQFPSASSTEPSMYKNSGFCLPVTFTQDSTVKKMIVTASEDVNASIVMFCASDKKNKMLTLHGHVDTVLALDCGRMDNGKDILISGGGVKDCSIKLWEQAVI